MSLSFFILCTDGLGSNYKHFRKTAKWNWRGDRTLLSFLEGWPRAAPVCTTEMRPLRDKPEWIRSSSPSVPGGHMTSWFRCGIKLSTIFFKRHREKKNLCLWLIFLAKLIYLVHSNRHCCNHLKWYFICNVPPGLSAPSSEMERDGVEAPSTPLTGRAPAYARR